MKPQMKVAIIKLGALGDVVRTSYIVNAYFKKFNAEIFWITRKNAFDLLAFNPAVSSIIDFEDIPDNLSFDKVFSLDDELESIGLLKKLNFNSLEGAYADEFFNIKYTPKTSKWFDMGLISKFGKFDADKLKKENLSSHGEIFSKIFDVEKPMPFFYGCEQKEKKWHIVKNKKILIGLNLFSGDRWPSKELVFDEAVIFINKISQYLKSLNANYQIVIFCDNLNSQRAKFYLEQCPYLKLNNTSESLLDFAAAIKSCDYVISTDSLGLHLAISQNIPNMSFYTSTSSTEIDTFGRGIKINLNTSEYCSYKKNTNNSSLTGKLLYEEWVKHFTTLKI
jgi:heptosyltransferase II